MELFHEYTFGLDGFMILKAARLSMKKGLLVMSFLFHEGNISFRSIRFRSILSDKDFA